MKSTLSEEEDAKGFFRFLKVFVATKMIVRSYRHSSIPIWLMILLATIAGTSWIYEGYFGEYMGNHIPYPDILLHGALWGILAGNIILFGGALLIKWLGQLFFKRKASYPYILRAYTLTVIFPSTLFALTWISTIILLGPFTFVRISPYLDQHNEVWYYLNLWTLTEAYAKTWIFGMAILGTVSALQLKVWQAFIIVTTPLAACFILIFILFDFQRALNWMV
ncbi:hypothetical protein [Bacillus sp. 179-C3.3 HS]|uniref:hypothetical protein n=1 Tax=Bacillus sp. 179-C3.3 HS TaxID=3232162 RepID=UPI00399F37D0